MIAAESRDLSAFYGMLALMGIQDVQDAIEIARDEGGAVDVEVLDKLLSVADKRHRLLARSGDALLKAMEHGRPAPIGTGDKWTQKLARLDERQKPGPDAQ